MRRVTFWRRSSRGVANRYKLLARMVALATVAGAFWATPITQGDSTSAQAKTPGKTYCFNRICHRVKTLAQTRREIGMNRIVSASHYDDCRRDRFNPCGLTSSGERFRANVPDNAASLNFSHKWGASGLRLIESASATKTSSSQEMIPDADTVYPD